MNENKITHVAAPGPEKPAVDVVKLCCTIVQQLDGLADEVYLATPSHSWRNLREVRADIKRLRSELEVLTQG